MPKLKANFEADWLLYLREQMINVHGWSADDHLILDKMNVGYRYFDSLRRRIVAVPRVVKTAYDFVCPLESLDGWNTLQEKVRKGLDINPHLSKGHKSLVNRDGLLAEWGVHHFHLGITADQKNPKFIGRTSSLLYALVTDNLFCVINVFSHKSFTDLSILESIHRNWPELISKYRAKNVTGATWAPEQRKALRDKNANTLTTMSDGTVYFPISGGVTASGLNIEAVQLSDYWLIVIRNLQNEVECKSDEIIPALIQGGYSDDLEIEATLQFSEAGASVLFPAYDLLVNLSIADAPISGI